VSNNWALGAGRCPADFTQRKSRAGLRTANRGEYNGRPGYKRQNKVFCVNGFKESFDTEEAERHGITRNVARHLPETTAGFAVAEDPASAPEEESASEEGLGRPGARGRRIN